MQLENLGSLITIKGSNTCLGYLMDFTGHGVFDAELGKLDISKEHVQAHNKALDEAMLQGLDNNCEIGQGSSFYTKRQEDGRLIIVTFMGTLVSTATVKTGRSLTFYRSGKQYRGRMSDQHDLFNFRRVK